MYLNQISGHKYAKYEGSMINHTDKRGNYREKEKWLPFQTVGSIDLIVHVYVNVENVKFYDQACGEDCPQTILDAAAYDNNDNDTQFMIVEALRRLCQMSQTFYDLWLPFSAFPK